MTENRYSVRRAFLQAFVLVAVLLATTSGSSGAPSGTPRFIVYLFSQRLHTFDWAAGASLTLTIDDPSNGPGVDFILEETADSTGAANMDLFGQFDIAPGQVFQVSDGGTTRTHTVMGLDITEVDPSTDIVRGTADPGGEVVVSLYYSDWPDRHLHTERTVVADGSGQWLADFSPEGITPGEDVDVRRYDNPGDWSQSNITTCNLEYSLTVQLDSEDDVHCRDWPAGATVTLTVDDPTNGTGVDYTEDRIAPPGGRDFDFRLEGANVKSGDLLTLSDGSTTIAYTVPDMTALYDPATGHLTGTAAPGTRIWVSDWATGNLELASADFNGEWQGGRFALGPAARGQAAQFDFLGNQTNLRWHAYTLTDHTFQLDRFEVTGNLPGTEVDEFDDGVLGAWDIYDPSVVESGGRATFGGAGTGVLDYFNLRGFQFLGAMTYIGEADSSPFEVHDGAGSFTAVSTWETPLPATDRFFIMSIEAEQVATSDDVDIGLGVWNAGPTMSDLLGLPLGTSVCMSLLGEIPLDELAWDCMAISPGQVTGKVLLQFDYDDTAKTFSGSFSLDGGSTFESPFSPLSWGDPVLSEFIWGFGGENFLELKPAEVATALCGDTAHHAWVRADDEGDNPNIAYRSCQIGGGCSPPRIIVASPTEESRPAVTCSGATVLVAWEDDRNGSPDIAVRRSTDGGATFGGLTFLVRGPDDETAPALAMSGSTVLAIWEDARRGNKDIGFRRSIDGGATWSPFGFLVRSPFAETSPAISLDGDVALVAWEDHRHGNEDIAYRRSVNQGAAWQPLRFLVRGPDLESQPTIALEGTTALMGWVDRRWGNADLALRRSTDTGTTFAAMQFVVRAPTSDIMPELAVHGTDALLTWADSRSGNRNISFRHSGNAAASWGPTARLVNASTDELSPSCDISTGKATCAWMDTRDWLASPKARESVTGGSSWGGLRSLD